MIRTYTCNPYVGRGLVEVAKSSNLSCSCWSKGLHSSGYSEKQGGVRQCGAETFSRRPSNETWQGFKLYETLQKSCPDLYSKRSQSTCYPQPPLGQCPPNVPGGGRRIVPPADCKPGPVPPNPCCPRYYHGRGTYKKYRMLFLLVSLPLIIIQSLNSYGHSLPHKGPCREYEYMLRRTKRFPWGDGVKSLFHNDHTNNLPGDCEPPPLECD